MIEKMTEIRKTVIVSPDLHKELKIMAAKIDKTIKKMVGDILRKELKLDDDKNVE